jgi:hypothetical protein
MMFRRELLRSLAAMCLPRWLTLFHPGERSHPFARGTDCAAIYRWAFGRMKALPPEHSDRLRMTTTAAIDDPQVRALIRETRPMLKAIRQAATIERCDWGMETVTVKDLTKGHRDVVATDLIRVACLSGRRHAATHRFSDALDDLFAGLTLAHRIGTGGVLFARLLECHGEVLAFRTLGRILPMLDRSALDDLIRRLDALPDPEPASASIGPESRFILGTLRDKLATMGATLRGEDWAELGFSDDEAIALARLTGGDRTAFLAHLESTGPAFAELARRLDLPRPSCWPALEEFASAVAKTQPIVAMPIETARGVRHVVDRMTALRAMLRAGVALSRSGMNAFQLVIDPYGNGPFALEQVGKGYLIRSALKDEGRAEVSLQVGDTG